RQHLYIMKKHPNYLFLSLILGFVLSYNPYWSIKAQTVNNTNTASSEAQQPLSYFNIYRGNSHSHTIFTWTHGEHREKGINDLASPTEFHPDWGVPPGVDWKDHNTI